LDPNVAYGNLCRAMENLDVTRGAEEAHVNDVVEAWHDLNTWLRNGGFPPSDWPVAPPAQRTSPPPVRVRDVDEMLDLLDGNPWRQ